MIWMVIWVILMMFWLFGGGYLVYTGPTPNPLAFGTGTLIPWTAVLILGLLMFGAIERGPMR
jgi:hypothetical protein